MINPNPELLQETRIETESKLLYIQNAKRENKKQRTRRLSKQRKNDLNLTVDNIYNDLKIVQDKWIHVNNIKDDIELKDLNFRYKNFTKRFGKLRQKYHKVILTHDSLMKDVRELAAKDMNFYMLINGWSFDINRSKMGEDPVIPFIPFTHQLPLLKALDGVKHIHVEKARRQGASAIMKHSMARDLELGKNMFVVATHKDLESLDGGSLDEAKNSTFEGVRWILSKSIFTPRDWRNEKKYWKKKRKAVWSGGAGRIGRYKDAHRRISMNGNTLHGAVLGKSTNVGSASSKIYTDEIDVVSHLYPNAMQDVLGSFAMSVNQVIAYSTYRSNEYSFYKIRQKNDTKQWAYITLKWKDNPICSNEWYDDMCSKLGRDEVLIARELDIDPTKSRHGLILKTMNIKRHFMDFTRVNFNRMTKVVGADFGGGESNTVFIFGYYDSVTRSLFLVDMLKGTSFNRDEIGKFFRKIGFEDTIIRGDESGISTHSSFDSSWGYILREQGLKYQPINNKNTYYQHQHMRNAFEEDRIYISNKKRELWNDLSNANYKNNAIEKNGYSHTFDALLYLFKHLNTGNVSGIVNTRKKY